jgi:hypothetical protein
MRFFGLITLAGVAGILFGGVLAFLTPSSRAAVVATAQSVDNRVTVHLTDERCALRIPPEASHLPWFKATWIEAGAPVPGCWTELLEPPHPIVMFWADNTVTIEPRGAFRWLPRG